MRLATCQSDAFHTTTDLMRCRIIAYADQPIQQAYIRYMASQLISGWPWFPTHLYAPEVHACAQPPLPFTASTTFVELSAQSILIWYHVNIDSKLFGQKR